MRGLLTGLLLVGLCAHVWAANAFQMDLGYDQERHVLSVVIKRTQTDAMASYLKQISVFNNGIRQFDESVTFEANALELRKDIPFEAASGDQVRIEIWDGNNERTAREFIVEEESAEKGKVSEDSAAIQKEEPARAPSSGIVISNTPQEEKAGYDLYESSPQRHAQPSFGYEDPNKDRVVGKKGFGYEGNNEPYGYEREDSSYGATGFGYERKDRGSSDVMFGRGEGAEK